MDSPSFNRGWAALETRFHVGKDDDRCVECFRLLKNRITNKQWEAACDALALGSETSDGYKFLPGPGDLERIAERYGKDGKPRDRASSREFCGNCYHGQVMFLKFVFAFAAPDDASGPPPLEVNVPPDGARSLEWFNRLPAYPIRWSSYLTTAFCDCRADALEASARKDGRERTTRTYREVLGFAVPPKEKQYTDGIRTDLLVMLSETFPMAETALSQERIWDALDLRRKREGDLVYEIGLWALQLGGVAGRKERPAPPPEEPKKPAEPKKAAPAKRSAPEEPRKIAAALDAPRRTDFRDRSSPLAEPDPDDVPWEG